MNHIFVPTSPGELIDKLTILRLKNERISDAEKQKNVRHELSVLQTKADEFLPSCEELSTYSKELYNINDKLWVIENNIREHEANKDFGAEFINLARAVYLTNDQRSEVKKKINKLLDSDFVEEKSHTEYHAG